MRVVSRPSERPVTKPIPSEPALQTDFSLFILSLTDFSNSGLPASQHKGPVAPTLFSQCPCARGSQSPV